MKFYRVTTNGTGIYEAVDRDCPKDSNLRKNKPDGSWLPKKGSQFPGAISYWTEYGWNKYQDSGLFKWQESVTSGETEVEILDQKPSDILYEDEYQLIIPTPSSDR
tara:strand:+ start:13106 stop:13423 length:318 start_codon:yes stop_codon:yes gene_type:complete